MSYFDSGLELHFWRYAAIFVMCFLVCSLVQDLRLKMFYDELFTLYMAQQGSPVEIVNATFAGMDASPPLYPILVSPLLHIVGQDALAVRLPSTLGFSAMLLFVLAFCHCRMPAVYSFIAALLVGVSSNFFATEGRCYGLVLGCAAGALFFWQAAHRRRKRGRAIGGLVLCLMLLAALHYYSIVLVGPLALGELVRWRTEKKLDLPIFVALLTPLLVIGVHWPLIAAFRRMSPIYWPGSTSWNHLLGFYFQFALIPLATMFLALVLFAAFDSPEGRRPPCIVLPPYEWAAMGALALTPIAVFAVSKYATHVFAPRYALPANIGSGILAACFLKLGSRRQPMYAAAVFVLLMLAAVLQQFLFTTSFNPLHTTQLRSDSGLRGAETIWRKLRALPDTSEPIVIGYNADFLELSYYAEPPLRRRLVYLLSRKLNLRYNGFDLDYVNLFAMRKRTNLAIVELASFLSANPRFILAVEPENDYLSRYLRSEGYRLVALDSNSVPMLYEVQHP